MTTLVVMDDADAFFTHTVVGAPFTVLLGRRLNTEQVLAQGVAVDPVRGTARLTQAWQDWVVLSHALDPVGYPRSRPERLRRWLERHALWLALTGLFSLTASAVTWGMWWWA